MQRIYQINDQCDLEVFLKDVTENEQERLNTLVEEFIQSHNEAETMGDEVHDGIQQGRITNKVIERLSKWCHTGGMYTSGEEPAKNLSRAVLGVVLLRLVDTQNARLPEYRDRILSMLEQYVTSLPL
jgi:hypothetical protein